MYNDADIQMAELTAAANMVARGVCHICEDYPLLQDGETEHAACLAAILAEQAEVERELAAFRRMRASRR